MWNMSLPGLMSNFIDGYLVRVKPKKILEYKYVYSLILHWRLPKHLCLNSLCHANVLVIIRIRNKQILTLIITKTID